jgi:hypothetical protein
MELFRNSGTPVYENLTERRRKIKNKNTKINQNMNFYLCLNSKFVDENKVNSMKDSYLRSHY